MKTAEDILKDKKNQNMVTVSAEATLFEALELMVAHKIGAMLVREHEDIIGIWTERDLLRNILTPGFDPKTARIRGYMQTQLKSLPHDTPIIQLKEAFLGLFIRHMLIIKEGKCIGMLSIGDVLRESLLSKDKEIKALNKIASWEYYENWSGKPKPAK
jgi:CBS domain-containing protein